MGCLFGQAYPHLVLLSLFGRDYGKIYEHYKHKHHHYLDVRVVAEHAEQPAVLVVEILRLSAGYVDHNLFGCVAQGVEAIVEECLVDRGYV